MIGYALRLKIFTHIFEIFSQTIITGLIIIFAPECRRFLMQLGGDFSLLNYGQNSSNNSSVQDLKEANKEIVDAIKVLQAAQTGALIIVEKSKAERYYVNPGYAINSNVSKEMLVTIFADKSPLHDGAVIIRGAKIALASVILPMTENPKLDWQYGTRHRAAIGFSEVTDALCFVVSEETGDISLASQGKLKRFDSISLVEKALFGFYSSTFKKQNRKIRLFRFLKDFFSPQAKISPTIPKKANKS